MACVPYSTARPASAGWRMPLSKTGKDDSEASHSRSSQVKADSSMGDAATKPEPASVSTERRGARSTILAIVTPGGRAKRLRSSASRRPSSGISTVTTRAEAPADAARDQVAGQPPVDEDAELEPPRSRL